MTYESRIKVGKGRFCSKECSNKFRIGSLPWNKGTKGLQKWSQERYKQVRKFMLGNSFAKGSVPWNKNTKGVMIAWNKGLKLPQFQNEKNPNWKGNDISYVALHTWVKRHRGIPKKCEHCGTTTAKKIEWANKDHTYRRILKDFISLCTSCHRKFDIKYNDYNIL